MAGLWEAHSHPRFFSAAFGTLTPMNQVSHQVYQSPHGMFMGTDALARIKSILRHGSPVAPAARGVKT